MSQCSRFQRLASEQYDRILSEKELAFMDGHRDACFPCSESERQTMHILGMLRECAIEPEPSHGFDVRVTRMVQLQGARERFTYWSPAFAGAVIAGLAILAVLQLITTSPNLPHFQMQNQPEASRTSNQLPTLLLDPSEKL